MTRKVEVCHCDKCGNEAEMTISCEMVEIKTPATGQVEKKTKETRVCKVCGNEANLIVDFE